MSVIWKFTLDPWDPWITMPADARMLHVREQSEQVRIWAEVNPNAPAVERRFGVGLTGGPVPKGAYIGTALVNEASHGGMEVVVHVYDTGETRLPRAALATASSREQV